MKRKDLMNLGLDKKTVGRIMAWNGMDIEREKRKRLELEKKFQEIQKYVQDIKKENKTIKEEAMYKKILEEIIHAETGEKRKMLIAFI